MSEFDWLSANYQWAMGRPDPKPPHGKIYYIGDGAGNVKIGYTTGPVEKRLKALQTGCPSALAVLAEHGGRPDNERALHNSFAEYRVRGEWFSVSGSLAEHIATTREMATQTYDAFGISPGEWPSWLRSKEVADA